jgi:N-acetylneuraminic acid mutarotase
MKDEPDKVVLIGWNTWIDGGAFSCAGSIEKDHIEWNNTYNQYIEPEAEDYYNRVIKLKAFL